MRRRFLSPVIPAILLATVSPLLPQSASRAAELERTVIDANFPDAYQVEVADVNGDKKPDIVAVGGGTCAWYENPTWTKRIVSNSMQTPGIISSATADITGDGKAEIAIAYDFEMNDPKKGKLLIATQGDTTDAPWTLKPMADIGSIHRLRWGDLDADGKLDLVVAPIFGTRCKEPKFDQENASLTIFYFKSEGGNLSWKSEVPFASFPIMHAIDVTADPAQDGRTVIFSASNTGVSKLTKGPDKLLGSWILQAVAPGSPGAPPKVGSSEVHIGSLADKRGFVTTIEPWHGTEVVCYLKEKGKEAEAGSGKRHVIDDQIMDGHALWVADIDGDGTDEIFAGHRGLDHRVSMYTFDPAGKDAWKRTVLDRDIAAQDLRGGDIDGDGKPDIVAVGGATHNVVWYHPKKVNP